MSKSYDFLEKSKWLWQKNGIIDHSTRAKFEGSQPSRVLLPVTIDFFQNTRTGFFDDIVQLINDGKLDGHLKIVLKEECIQMESGEYHTPSIDIDSRLINVHETFLSYQWCICYAIYTLYV